MPVKVYRLFFIGYLGDIGAKFATFGWHTQNVNGADVEQIYEGIQTAKQVSGKPAVIILDTIKGQGVRFVEEILLNHHIIIDPEKAKAVIAELEQRLAKYN